MDGAQGNTPSSFNEGLPSRTNGSPEGSPTQSLAEQLAANKNINNPSKVQPTFQKKNKRKNGYGK